MKIANLLMPKSTSGSHVTNEDQMDPAVTAVGGGAVSVIDLSTNRITDTVCLGVGAPTQMVLSPDKTRAYIVDYDHIAVLCTLCCVVFFFVSVVAWPLFVSLVFCGVCFF